MFEPELWDGSAHLPSGKVPTRYGAAAAAAAGNASATSGSAPVKSASAPAKPSDGLKLWDGGSFDFHDILDVINPLHHLPVVNSIYRAESGDEIGAVPRILGSMLYGGGLVGALIGAASAIVNIVVEHETGKDLGQHIYTALFGEGDASRRSTQLAAPKTGDTKSSEAKAGDGPNAASPAGAAKAAIAAVPGAASAHGAQGAQGAKAITPKAHAALQAFVAGLAKHASPAAATAAKSAIARSTVRIAGITSAAGAANPGTIKGEVSSQFRRADWYQRNQAVLKAQTAALAKHHAASKSATRTAAPAAKANTTDAASAILQLFTTPGGTATRSAKPGANAGSATKAVPAANAPTPIITPKINTGPAKPAAAERGAIAGPWVANEIANALSKYETLVKARNAAAAAK
ncbi:MAG TPA: hypothetical protein VM325_15810 [Alphaproteobacteria bacterium]|nr:hypothetical protein [Alphaproteobacteria bacterium]